MFDKPIKKETIFQTTRQDMKDMNMTLQDIINFTDKISSTVIIQDVCIVSDGMVHVIQ